jgi:L-aspartate oxidase
MIPGPLDGRPVIVGAGLAGLMTALRLAPEPVVLLAKGAIGAEASSAWAQGGLAASLGEDDAVALHLADTLAAGDGLCDAAAAAILREAPAAIDGLARLGCRFDRGRDGKLALGLEAAHGRRRIVHAAGDGTGRELMRALGEVASRTPSITVLERTEARRLLVEDGRVAGVLVVGPRGAMALASDRVVLATGGLGGLYLDCTSPFGCFGQGLALAARAGAVLADLEFVQFHPTALDGPARPMRLISEAVRGEGAVLVDETGRRFLADLPGAELAPRDAVARRIARHLAAGHRVYLDMRARPGPRMAERFPTISAACRAVGLDPAIEPIPVRPAAHHHIGGVAVDAAGRTSVPGLWACGEVASTGLHGANRLASNSLIEAAVCAGHVAASVAGTPASGARRPRATALPPTPDPSAVRPILSRHLGIERDEAGLLAAIRTLLPLASSRAAASDPAIVGLMTAVMALGRQESRGAHHRTDFPRRAPVARRATIRLDGAFATAAELTAAPLTETA